MMIATWVGASLPLPVTARDFGTSDMKDVFFLGRQGLVDLLHHLVRELLDLGAPLAMFVFVDLVALLERLQRLHAVATDVADGDAPVLGDFVGKLHQLLRTLLVKRR